MRAGHAAQQQVLARAGGRQHIEFIKPHDAVDRLRAGYIHHSANIILDRRVIVDRFYIIETGPHPGLVQQLFTRNKRHVPPRILTFFEKLVTLVLARDANYVVFHKTGRCLPPKRFVFRDR